MLGIPLVATISKLLLGKGLGGLASKIVTGGTEARKIVGDVLGIDADNKTEWEKALDDPAKLSTLKDLKVAELNAEIADRKSARDREVAITKVTGGKDYYMYTLGGFIVVGFFGLIVVIFTVELPASVPSELLFLLVGTLVSKFGSVVDYFFGSSKSSSDKTTMIGK